MKVISLVTQWTIRKWNKYCVGDDQAMVSREPIGSQGIQKITAIWDEFGKS